MHRSLCFARSVLLLALVLAMVAPASAQSGTPVLTEPVVESLFEVTVQGVEQEFGLQPGPRPPTGVLVMQGAHPEGMPLPFLLGPGQTGMVYVVSGAVTVETIAPGGWADPNATYGEQTVDAGEVAVLPPTDLAILTASAASTEIIRVRLALPTTIPQAANPNPETERAMRLFAKAEAAGYREAPPVAWADFLDAPTGDLSLRLEAVTLPPGTSVPAGRLGSATTGGVISGEATFAVTVGEAPQTLTSELTPSAPPDFVTVIAGETVTLEPGGFYALPPGAIGELSNEGGEPVTMLRAVVTAAG